MFRTKDLVLLLLTVAILVISIVYVASNNIKSDSQTKLVLNTPEITSVSAEISEPNESTLSREERLARMRALIEKSESTIISQATEPTVALEEDMVTTAEVSNPEPLLCSAYNPSANPLWPVAEIQQQSVEGVRQYFTSQIMSVGTSSSSTVSKNVLLTLPQPFIPAGGNNCLTSNIIGVALDGSLIRNDEVRLYSLFTDETLIGYALDGFPIYGVGSQPTDSCGGRIEFGQYRYELSNERSTIINCYRGAVQAFSQ